MGCCCSKNKKEKKKYYDENKIRDDNSIKKNWINGENDDENANNIDQKGKDLNLNTKSKGDNERYSSENVNNTEKKEENLSKSKNTGDEKNTSYNDINNKIVEKSNSDENEIIVDEKDNYNINIDEKEIELGSLKTGRNKKDEYGDKPKENELNYDLPQSLNKSEDKEDKQIKKTIIDDSFEENKDIITNPKVNIEDFELLKFLSKGAFTSIYLAKYKKNKKLYTIKIFNRKQNSKVKVREKTIKSERDIMVEMSEEDNPFLLKIKFAFYDCNHLYIGTDFMQGGDLNSFFAKSKKFDENITKF